MSFQVSVELNKKQDKVGSLLQSRLFSSNNASSDKNLDTMTITVLNTETLDEYDASSVHINSDYTSKLLQWIEKKRFSCENIEDNLLLKVDNVFTFMLQKRQKSEIEKVKEQMKSLRQDRVGIDLQMKLFNQYFFCFWNEKNREAVLKNHLFNNPITDITQLYYVLEGVGHNIGGGNAAAQADHQLLVAEDLSDEVSQGSMFQQSNKNQFQQSSTQYYLGFRELFAQEIVQNIDMQHTVAQQSHGSYHSKMGKVPATFSVIIYGPGCKEHILVKMSKEVGKRDIQSNQQTYYYWIGLNVKNDQRYTIYIPKLIFF